LRCPEPWLILFGPYAGVETALFASSLSHRPVVVTTPSSSEVLLNRKLSAPRNAWRAAPDFRRVLRFGKSCRIEDVGVALSGRAVDLVKNLQKSRAMLGK